MDQLGNTLQAVGYFATVLRPLLPMYFHLIVSALFSIYIGAHASLSRPSSAAEPPKKTKKSADDGASDDSESEQKMEGLSPTDVILFPLTAGITLIGLYYVMKYLEDPALLNKILNWLLALSGTFALNSLLKDSMSTVWSFIFPNTYQQADEIWKVDPKARKAWATKKTQLGRSTPLPHYLAFLPLSFSTINALWSAKSISSHKFQIRAYIYNGLKTNFSVGPFDLISFVIAVALELYFNLVAKPWWLTNVLGFSVSYTALQIMSPTSAWIGTSLLSGLFFYDIYFVFFTPIMITVATQIDIPAKLVFPNPGSQHLSMLGLGDIVLPGILIGFALRFDLFLHYLHKKDKCKTTTSQEAVKRENDKSVSPTEEEPTVKAKYVSATGGWGERFWAPEVGHGGYFPKTYFSTTMVGYVIGMVITLGVMQTSGHGQPALLYLVPAVVCALWGTALVRGETQILRNYREDSEDEHQDDHRKDRDDKKENHKEASSLKQSSWMDWFVAGRIARKLGEKDDAMNNAAQKIKNAGAENVKNEEADDRADVGKIKDPENDKAKDTKWDGQLVSFSISLT